MSKKEVIITPVPVPAKKTKKERAAELPIMAREALPEDLNFVFNSWLISYKQSKTLANLDGAFYYQGQHNIIERCLRQSQVLMLVDANKTEDIYSYIVYQEIDGIFTVHFAYVKHLFRGLGLFKHMLDLTKGPGNSVGLYTHDTKSARHVGDKHNLYYNPYILFERLEKLPENAIKVSPQELERQAEAQRLHEKIEASIAEKEG
jgi:hypothetical protein